MPRKTAKVPASLTPLTLDPRNANRGTERGRKMLADSLRDLGAGRSIVADRHGVIIAGNKTLEAAQAAGIPVQVVETDGERLVVVQRRDLDLATDPKARKLAFADNRVAEADLEWDVSAILEAQQGGMDLSGLWDDDELATLLAGVASAEASAPSDAPSPSASLAERFGVPPFSVLDARQGYWQERKRAWLALGIRSEIGRGGQGAYPVTGSAASVTDSLSEASAKRDTRRKSDASDGLFQQRAGRRQGKAGKGKGRTWGEDLMRGERKY